MARHRRRPGNCQLCGTFRNGLHRDHIVPKFKGGADVEENIQHICANCRQDKTAEERRGIRFLNRKKDGYLAPRLPRTDETKRKLSLAITGKKLNLSPEERRRRADHLKMVRITSGRKGK